MTRVLKGLALAIVIAGTSAFSAACVKNEACKYGCNAAAGAGTTQPANPVSPTAPGGNLSATVEIWSTSTGVVQGTPLAKLGEAPCNGRAATFNRSFSRNTNYVAKLVAQGRGRGSLRLIPTTSGPVNSGMARCDGVEVDLNGGSCPAGFNTFAGGSVGLSARVLADDGGRVECTVVLSVP